MPRFPGQAGARVGRAFVDGDKQHFWVGVEKVLGAIAVVDIPIHYGHPPQAICSSRRLGGDSDIVKKAEAHGSVFFGVVAGGATEHKGIFALARHYRLEPCERTACGVERCLV
ncbi:MAG: hypothetical protein DDT34_02120 [Firmicutes bacterium]|nr:hypothetical protein [Bacillota bacterium]